MPLDRQSIQKKDFPIGRRGYDPDAVDAHLQWLAEQIDDLRRSSRQRTDTLASAASEQVRAIVEAAERTASEIQRQAEAEASEIRDEAAADASRQREQATDQARDYVGRVSEASSVMLQRIDAMESELGALLESLRTGSNRLSADLQLLGGNLGDLQAAAGPRPRFEPEPAAVAEPAAPVEPEPDPEPAPAAYEPVSDVADGGADDDAEGARLIALNMALDGTPREQTAAYLSENFELAEQDALLDEVYATVEG